MPATGQGRQSRDAGPSCPSRSRRPVGASQADGPGVRFGKRGADFSSTSSEFKSLGAFFCNVVSSSFLRLLSRSGHRRPRTRSCRFEASEPIPFPGADSIFSSCCGAISGRLLFAVSLSRRDPGDRAWELRNQPKSKPLCRSPSAGGLYVISICYKTFQNRSLHFPRCLSSNPTWNTALPPRIGEALRTSKNTLA